MSAGWPEASPCGRKRAISGIQGRNAAARPPYCGAAARCGTFGAAPRRREAPPRAGLPAPASAPGAAERRRGVPPAPGLAGQFDAVGVVDDAVHHRVRDGGFPDGQCIILSLHRVLDGVCQAGFMATLVDEFPDCIVLSWRFVEEACLAGSALPDHSL